MPEIKYNCYFHTWERWMDGTLIIGKLEFNYDFVAENDGDLSDTDHIINPFSEEGARKHFADMGIPNIEFVYPNYDYSDAISEMNKVDNLISNIIKITDKITKGNI